MSEEKREGEEQQDDRKKERMRQGGGKEENKKRGVRITCSTLLSAHGWVLPKPVVTREPGEAQPQLHDITDAQTHIA